MSDMQTLHQARVHAYGGLPAGFYGQHIYKGQSSSVTGGVSTSTKQTKKQQSRHRPTHLPGSTLPAICIPILVHYCAEWRHLSIGRLGVQGTVPQQRRRIRTMTCNCQHCAPSRQIGHSCWESEQSRSAPGLGMRKIFKERVCFLFSSPTYFHTTNNEFAST